MHVRTAFVAALLALAVAAPALAAKGPPKLKMLGALLPELGAEPSDDALKALKVADRCANADKTWQRAMEPEMQTGIDTLYELMLAPVTCWQGAAKKGEKAGESYAAVQKYVEAQRGYAETLRAYVFALQAKLVGDQLNACKRFQIAIEEAAAATTASEGVVEGLASVEAKTLAVEQTQNILAMGTTITDEYTALKCD